MPLNMPTGSSSLTSKRAVGNNPNRVASPRPGGNRPGSASAYTGSNFLSGLSRFSDAVPDALLALHRQGLSTHAGVAGHVGGQERR